MCLLVPGKIIKIENNKAIIDYDVEKREAGILESVYNEGDYVLVQGGFIVQKVPEKEAVDALKLYKEALNE